MKLRLLQSKKTQALQPHITIKMLAWQKMWHLVSKIDTEVGWLGEVKRENNEYTITDIHLLEQTVHSTETEMKEDAMMKFYKEHGSDITTRCNFWGHSHVNMSCTPSGTDEKTMEGFENSGFDYFLRGIFNKRGEMEFALIEFKTGFIWEEVPYSWDIPEDLYEGEGATSSTFSPATGKVIDKIERSIKVLFDEKKLNEEIIDKVKKEVKTYSAGGNINNAGYTQWDQDIWDYEGDYWKKKKPAGEKKGFAKYSPVELCMDEEEYNEYLKLPIDQQEKLLVADGYEDEDEAEKFFDQSINDDIILENSELY